MLMLNPLIANQQLVQAFWDAVNSSAGNLETIGPLVRKLLTTGAWQDREVPQLGRVVHFDRFVDFIRTKPLEGCGWSEKKVEMLIKDDKRLLADWHEAITNPKGHHHDNIMMKALQGTSLSYIVSRLKRQRPDLFEKVVAREMSAHAAAIEAGFVKKLTPFEQVLKLLPKLMASEREQLKERLSAYD